MLWGVRWRVRWARRRALGVAGNLLELVVLLERAPHHCLRGSWAHDLPSASRSPPDLLRIS